MIEDRVKELGSRNKEEPRKMKDSGVEWIGKIPEEWETCKVKNVYSNPKEIVVNRVDLFERLALTLKGVLKRPKEDAEGLQPERFEGYQILRENQLVFKLIDLENVRTSRVGLSPYTGLVSPAYIVLDNSMTSKFGYYFFLSMWHREIFNQLGGDGVRSSIGPKDLLNLPYLLIDNEEQQAIANYLDSKVSLIDDIIEKTKQSIEDYKKYKQSLITETVTKGLNPDVEMKDSGIEWIGEVPKHWGVVKLKNVTRLRNERNNGSNLLDYVGLENIESQTGRMKLTDKEEKQSIESSSNLFYKGDVLFGKLRPYLAKCVVADFDGQCSTELLIIRSIEGFSQNIYLKYLMLSSKFIDLINSSTYGTKMPRANWTFISDQHIPLPAYEEQQQIAEYLDTKCSQIDRIIDQKKTLINELETYKKSLIYECVTGKRYVG